MFQVFGGLLAGWASDCLGRRAIVSFVMIILTIPTLFVFNILTAQDHWLSICLMFLTGALVNGPYSLISGVVAIDLGSHHSLKGNHKAMATITGIVDGTGLIITTISHLLGWDSVFYFLMSMCVCSGLCLVRLVLKEQRDYYATD
jgi:OPA family glycerol-3-phosphate transporter-like MFS transporter 1/2